MSDDLEVWIDAFEQWMARTARHERARRGEMTVRDTVGVFGGAVIDIDLAEGEWGSLSVRGYGSTSGAAIALQPRVLLGGGRSANRTNSGT